MTGLVWLNGALLPAASAGIGVADRGFLLGDGLFETVCWRDGAVVRLDAHLARLARGATVLGLPLPPLATLAAALADTAVANDLKDGSLRLTVSAGPGARGLPRPAVPVPTLLVTAAPGGTPLPPARVVTATVTRRNEHSPLSRVKCLNYLDQILARNEATARGADDAVLLNTAGQVACATAATLFAMVDGALVTPPLPSGALPGTRRAAVLAALGGEERTLAPADLRRATEVFFTSSLMVRPVVALDGQVVGDGRPGAMAAAAVRLT
ncbi:MULTISPECIES: aminotransferase class IV [Nitrospirillum]|uniref:Probable branched-chain-amino-acid aminotransferase n=1 Tax=Nitrospirillum amazonense TaxID=28077 RepID=A0A560FRN8_9PROT|nr:aminotransferase class IV [Nitrospirillum amazonense]MEC4593743.1 aminotransferase class IV [Nitrospirillum amazonense]TWB24294.1 branched-chain amino acid aminotransferase [Nitrospirillum amazonense]